jgi:hypothetical protein
MMRTILAAVLAAFLIAVPASAGTGLTPDMVAGGAALDYLRGPEFDQQVVPIQLGYSYAFEASRRTSFHTGHRILAAPGNEDTPSAYVNEFQLVMAYDVGRGFNLFAGPVASIWGEGLVGQREELYGIVGGVSFPLEDNARMLVGYRSLGGGGDLSQHGLIFGPAFTL